MFMSESAGVISKSPYERNVFWWKTPNCFSYQLTSSSVNHDKWDRRVVSSPLFSAFNNKWRLALVPTTTDSGNVYIGLFLWMASCSNETPNIKVKLILVNHDDGSEYKSFAGNVDLQDGCFGTWEFLYVARFSDSKNLISPAGVLKFVCIMEERLPVIFCTPGSSVSGTQEEKNDEHGISEDALENETHEVKGVDRLLENLKSILVNEESFDVILKVEDRDFKVHKPILVARSPVFASMFRHDMQENTTGEVNIPDCSAAAFEIFLMYLYTASADNMSSDNIIDLYYAADKYQVNDLKVDCIEYMENNLSVENFCSIMTFSLRHSQSEEELELKAKATDFFCDNVKAIIKTVQWREFLRDYHTEANKLYIKAIDA